MQNLLVSGEFDARSLSSLLHACAMLGYANSALCGAAALQLARPEIIQEMAPQVRWCAAAGQRVQA
jgi:hypothetical protein